MNTYLIYGSDYGLIKREIENIIKDATDVAKYDLTATKIDELLDDASCISLFGEQKIIVGENANFLTGAADNVGHNIDYLTRYIMDDEPQNILILYVVTDKLDERKKIVKLIKEKCKVIYKEVINEKDLPSFVVREFENNGYKIDYKTASYFVNYIGKNVDILLSEINKMIIYKDEEKKITISDINEISSKGFNDNIFDLTDGIMKKDFKKIFECYKDLLTLKEEPIRIISMLGNQFNLVYQCKLLDQERFSQKEIASKLKVHPYRVKLALETNYMIYELEDIIKKLHNLDYEIKTSKVDKNIGLENFLLRL